MVKATKQMVFADIANQYNVTRRTIRDLHMALSLSELKREIEALQERLTKVREYL